MFVFSAKCDLFFAVSYLKPVLCFCGVVTFVGKNRGHFRLLKYSMTMHRFGESIVKTEDDILTYPHSQSESKNIYSHETKIAKRSIAACQNNAIAILSNIPIHKHCGSERLFASPAVPWDTFNWCSPWWIESWRDRDGVFQCHKQCKNCSGNVMPQIRSIPDPEYVPVSW